MNGRFLNLLLHLHYVLVSFHAGLGDFLKKKSKYFAFVCILIYAPHAENNYSSV